MKSHAISCIFLYLFLSLQVNTIAQSLPLKIKEYAKSAPASQTKSPLQLAHYLTKDEDSQQQKALNIYTWLIYNIRYDTKEFSKIKRKSYTPKQTLKRKKGLCYQYSGLFNELCSHAGIISKEIIGYSKGPGYTEGDLLYETNHSWNAVYLDSRWYLLDATWGSGHIIPKKQRFKELLLRWFRRPFIRNSYRFQQNPSLDYFLSEPEFFIQRHLPADPSWQLLLYPVSLKSFEDKNWKGYLGKLDPWEGKKVTVTEYESILNPYKRMSPIRFYGKMARMAQEFNPINTQHLASYYFSIAPNTSLYQNDLEARIRSNTNSLEQYTKASKYAKNHIQQTKSTTLKNIKTLQHRFFEELEKPLKKRIYAVQTDLLWSRLKLRSTKKGKLILEREKLTTQNSLQKLKMVQTKKYDRSKKPQTELIKKNQILITETRSLMNAEIDSLVILQKAISTISKNKSNLQAEIKKQNEELNQIIDANIDAVKGYQNVNLLSLNMNKMGAWGDARDQSQLRLIEMNKKLIRKEKASKKAVQMIVKQGKLIQSLYLKNCSLSAGQSCGNSFLESIYQDMRSSYELRLQMIDSLFQIMRRDNFFHTSFAKTLSIQEKKLDLAKSYLSLYLEIAIKEKRRKEARNLTYLDRLIFTSNRERKALRAKNSELNRRIREQKD